MTYQYTMIDEFCDDIMRARAGPENSNAVFGLPHAGE